MVKRDNREIDLEGRKLQVRELAPVRSVGVWTLAYITIFTIFRTS